MRGVYWDGTAIRLRQDLPVPVPEAGEVLLTVGYAGICDTDIQLARGYMGYRGVLGHEFVGRTADGQRVTAEINNACHSCPTCGEGRPGHCPHRSVLGILNHDGAMADLVAVPARNLHAIPDSVPDRQAVFIEPLAAAFRVIEQVQPGAGTRLAVLGDGKLGLLCVWVARLSGADTHLIGKHDAKLVLAGDGVTTHRVAAIEDLSRAFDVVVDCTGSKTGLTECLRLVRPCGTVVLKTTVAGTYDIDLSGIVIDEVRVLGSRCGPFPRAIAALAAGEVDITPLIGAEFPLERAEEAFRAAVQPGARKILLRVE
jgi:threonine dehydrogenase-like Zn-dependent dehydrogenase